MTVKKRHCSEHCRNYDARTILNYIIENNSKRKKRENNHKKNTI